jgi:hypothetical protein
MTDRQQRLVNNGYAIAITKSFLIIGVYSKNTNNMIKKILHYLPVKIERI